MAYDKQGSLTLLEFYETIYRLHRPTLSGGTDDQYRETIKAFTRLVGNVSIASIDVEMLARFRCLRLTDPVKKYGRVLASRSIVSPATVNRQWRCILNRAGVWDGGDHPWHTARVTCATYICRLRGIESAARQLGHADSAMTRNHYLDNSKTGWHDGSEALPDCSTVAVMSTPPAGQVEKADCFARPSKSLLWD